MERFSRLVALLKTMPAHGVAFSGGVDSTLLLRAAAEAWGEKARAFMVSAAFHAKGEQAEARELAKDLRVPLTVIPLDVCSVPGLIDNPPERCYLCKRAAFSAMIEKARAQGLAGIIDGSNTNDLGEHRPGLRALKELEIRSPMVEAGLAKADIRELSRLLNLPTANKPALACLATRIPYGVQLTEERLSAVEAAEVAVWKLGFSGARVRHHGDIARIEIAADRLVEAAERAASLCEAVKAAGFRYVSLDLAGYRTGSMD